MRSHFSSLIIMAIGLVMLSAVSCGGGKSHETPNPNLNSVFLPDSTSTATQVSCVPANGDVNPYGVAFVPNGFPTGGKLTPGDILVSNFNASSNLQGTGTTIVKIDSAGQQSLFFQGTAPLGLTTALVVLQKGFVIVGNLPTTDGTSATATAGSLLILDKNGNLLQTLTDQVLLNGPWDMTVSDRGDNVMAFVSNVLSGSITRMRMVFNTSGLVSHQDLMIASGYTHRGDPAALVVGPTGLVYDTEQDVLYVASTADNAIYKIIGAGAMTAIPQDSKGVLVYSDNTHLHGPLGLALAPNHHFLVTNSDVINSDPSQPSEIVEFDMNGNFISQLSVDPAQGGSFGLDLRTVGDTTTLAAVDDATSMLLIWKIQMN